MNGKGVGEPGSHSTSTHVAGTLVLGLVVCLLAISQKSYWIDECGVAYKAALPTISEFWYKISTEGSADLQQPFHHFFAWGWEKIVGLDEFAMRAGNIPFFLTGLAVATWAFRRSRRLLTSMALVLLTSPFVWFYLNEARPYAVQMGASLIVFSALYRLAHGPDGAKHECVWVPVLCGGMVLLAMSGMLAMLWLGAYLLAALTTTPMVRLKYFLKAHWLAWSVTIVLLLGMGIFYLWTLSIGARATAVGGTDLRNLGFIPYELLGFSGLGPGRLAIRTDGLQAFMEWLPAIACFALAAGVVLLAGWQAVAEFASKKQRLFWALCFLLVGGFILLVGVVVHFRVLGRHCTPVLPLVVLMLGAGIARLWTCQRALPRVAVIAFVALALVSCFSVRLASRHAKDDYRAAAWQAQAELKRGATVWWNADPEGATIYGLPVATNAQPGKAIWVANPLPGFETNLPAPDVVLSSKPDVYDGNGALAEYLQRLKYQRTTTFSAFTKWESAAPKP